MKGASTRIRHAALAGLVGSALLAACDEGPFLVSGVVIGSLSLTPASLAIALQETDSVTLEVFDEEGQILLGQRASWVSENPAVATVEGRAGGATVTAVAEGLTRIQVTVGQTVAFLDVEVFVSAFDIEVRYLGTPPTAGQRAVFDDAVSFWRSAIVGDLADFNADIAAGECGGVDAPQVQETIDDLLIFVDFQDIDGAGGTLGSAAPCWLRSSTLTPFMGGMAFDNADLPNLEASGNLESTVRHEMGHVLGIGTLWGQGFFDLLVNPSDTAFGGTLGADAHFNGPLAIAAFNGAGGSGYPDAKVPVENDADTYGSGSLDGHWRESVMVTELMTPSLNGGGSNPTSAITIQSLADMGYEVNLGAADPYTVANPLSAFEGPPLRQIWIGNDIPRSAIGVMDENGRVVRILRR
ncbi:MAG: Ig-like domain-containing protein [Gemmatimonadota bacterium]|nr:Ig-like domain-containing protein [Gemmatimonadota bacterium]